ncbi:MAG: DivIVA domain-containing protein [Peptococcaceae bacterium]|jgi:cell division initiation protein|nr:DivIVA domain-containing protein [Peptococcaceae bacterium]
MAMTPIDISKTKFHREIRGYYRVEVDKFMDVVGKEFAALYTENIDLKETVERLEKRVNHYQMENKLQQQTIILDQQMSATVKKKAKEEADLIIQAAKQERDRQLSDAEMKKQEIQADIEKMSRKQETMRAHLETFLTMQLETLGGSGKDHGDKTEPAWHLIKE